MAVTFNHYNPANNNNININPAFESPIYIHIFTGNIGKLHKKQNGVIQIELLDGRIYFAPEKEFTRLY